MKSLIKYIQELPERQFSRLKNLERNVEPRIDLNKVVKKSLSEVTLFGDLNYSKFLNENSYPRRYFFKFVPYHLGSAFTSIIALPAVLVKTVYSIFKSIFGMPKSSSEERIDTILSSLCDLGTALSLIVKGVCLGISKCFLAPFRDIAKIVQERKNKKAFPKGKIAFIGIDLQKTFVEGGNLAVSEEKDVVTPAIELINHAAKKGYLTVLTQDWHGKSHKSFAINSGFKPYTTVRMSGLANQMLWPVHAMQGTKEAGFIDGLPLEKIDFVIKKGFDDQVDSYGAFFDNGGIHQTALHELLQGYNISTIVAFGIATDYCVLNTVKQAHDLGYKVILVEDACRSVANNTRDSALETMRTLGVEIVNAQEILDGRKF